MTAAETPEPIRLARRQSIADTLRRSARRHPDRPAILEGDTRWSYAEFDRLTDRLARGLRDSGLGRGDRVAILSRNSAAFALTRYAVARAGLVLVPINFMLNAAEVRFILESSGARALACGPDLAALAAEAAAGTAVERLIALEGWPESPESSPESPKSAPSGAEKFVNTPLAELLSDDETPLEIALSERDLAQIVYTSGTESLPKGAMLDHGAVLWEYVTCIVDAGLSAEDVMLHALPLYHCAQLDAFLGPAIMLGMTNVITAQPAPGTLLPLLERHAITAFFAPPTVWIALLRAPEFDRTDLSALRKGWYGASIMPVEVLKELARRLPEVRLWNLYGQTEIAPVATALQPGDQLRKPGSAGKPALNVETRVVDDAMQDVAAGEIGEIVHRSPQLLSGYWNDPERTAEAFAGGWFHSGDLATVDAEGFITVVDRKKDMIKTGGENVSSREVEECIHLLDGVSEVAVIGLPHEKWIETVAAVVVPKAGVSLDPEAIIAHCRESLAHYKAPTRVLLAESLPKNPSGKILKRDLRALHGGDPAHLPGAAAE